MADRNSELKKGFIRATHPDGTVENESGDSRFAAAKRQTEPLANLNDPNQMTRQGRHGQTEKDQPVRGGRDKKLELPEDTKNLLP